MAWNGSGPYLPASGQPPQGGPPANLPTYTPTDTLPPVYYPPSPSNAPTITATSGAPTVADPPMPAPPQQMWPALLTLFFLAPAVGELLSGSTPPPAFFNPVTLIFEASLYGSGAILVREIVRRRGLGWGSVLLLGTAYGVLEEGLVTSSWFNSSWPGLGALATYGRLLDTSWVWALGLTIYHAVVSIAVPIGLVEVIFPTRARWPWLGRKSYRAFAVLLAVVSVLGALNFGFVAYRQQGYTHPPLMYLGALAIAALLFWLGTRILPRRPARSPRRLARLPSLWTLRLLALGTAIIYFVVFWGAPHLLHDPLITMLCLAGIFALGVWRVSSWGARPGWGVEQRLALASGAMGFFLLLAPVVEFSIRRGAATGMTLAAFVWLAGLIALAWRAGRLRARGIVL